CNQVRRWPTLWRQHFAVVTLFRRFLSWQSSIAVPRRCRLTLTSTTRRYSIPSAAISPSSCSPSKRLSPSTTSYSWRVPVKSHCSEEDAAMAKQYPSPPKMAIDPNKQYSAVFHTNRGDFTVELFTRQAPITVNNFVFLARDGFYNGTTFHRVLKDFMA